jgi:hypothetical protein
MLAKTALEAGNTCQCDIRQRVDPEQLNSSTYQPNCIPYDRGECGQDVDSGSSHLVSLLSALCDLSDTCTWA